MSTIRETHLGVVTDRNDPEQRGRIRVAVASLMGTDDNDDPVEYPNWVEPRFQHRTTAVGDPEHAAKLLEREPGDPTGARL